MAALGRDCAGLWLASLRRYDAEHGFWWTQMDAALLRLCADPFEDRRWTGKAMIFRKFALSTAEQDWEAFQRVIYAYERAVNKVDMRIGQAQSLLSLAPSRYMLPALVRVVQVASDLAKIAEQDPQSVSEIRKQYAAATTRPTAEETRRVRKEAREMYEMSVQNQQQSCESRLEVAVCEFNFAVSTQCMHTWSGNSHVMYPASDTQCSCPRTPSYTRNKWKHPRFENESPVLRCAASPCTQALIQAAPLTTKSLREWAEKHRSGVLWCGKSFRDPGPYSSSPWVDNRLEVDIAFPPLKKRRRISK